MIGNKKALINVLNQASDDDIFILEKNKTKAFYTRSQQRTRWKIFKAIGDKLGYKKETVRTNILTALFGTYECKMFGKTHLIPNKTSTTELSKEDAIQVIDASLEYAKKIDAGVEITPREISSLYESYGVEYHPLQNVDNNFYN